MSKQNPEDLLQKIKELESELKKVKSCKRYGLVWEDKPEIFEEKAKNALPILQEDKSLRIEEDENKPNNIIIEGDNYHSLSALSYTHKGKIDVIYIDPPYNTGNKDFIYNDSFVDKEDSYRHSKWLSFMSKRLKLAKELLSDDGVIYMSIDDNEGFNLKLLSDEIFGENNFIQNFYWNKSSGGSSLSKFTRTDYENIFCYGKKIENINFEFLGKYSEGMGDSSLINKPNQYKKLYFEKGAINFLSIKRGKIKIFKNDSLELHNEIIIENGLNKNSVSISSKWKWSQGKLENEILQNTKIISKTKDLRLRYIKANKGAIIKPTKSITNNDGVGYTVTGSSEIQKIFGKSIFDYPKPSNLIKYLVNMTSYSKLNSIILDFFAGSGTTGHAVMELNREDGGNRQFILCSSKENSKEDPEKNICRDITYERNKRVIEGYTNSKGDKIEGLGGNLRYYTTEFIKADKSIDDLRYSFIDMCDDLLCIKENTFTEIKLKNAVPELRLFKKGEKYTAILYDIHHFKDLVKLLEVLDGEISVYIFSLSKDIFEEELEQLNKKITVQNIPDDILQTYKKIFNF